MKVLVILFAVYGLTFSSKCDYSFGKSGALSAEVHFIHRFHIPRGDTRLEALVPNDHAKMISHVCVNVTGVDYDLDTVVINFSTSTNKLTIKLAYPASRKVWVDVIAEQHGYLNLRGYYQNPNSQKLNRGQQLQQQLQQQQQQLQQLQYRQNNYN